MASSVSEIDWSDFAIAIPAFLTMMMIPLTFSIANGLAFGFTAFTFLRIFRGEFRKVSPVVYILTLLFLFRFWYM
jgi:adenine/guanine/hypoxanthine permease